MKKTIKSLKGKTIKSIGFDTPYQTKIVIAFTDGTEAEVSTYQAGIHNDTWAALTATIIEAAE
jgi:hypothetical protein